MKKLCRLFLLAAAFASAPIAQASGTYNFSYKLFDGPVATGSFTGDASGNLIHNLSNVSVYMDGVAFNGNGTLFSAAWGGRNFTGSAVASFDGLGNNFIFADAPSFSHMTNYFYTIPWSNPVFTDAAQAYTPLGAVDYFNGNYNAANWHVAAVPEPETYAMMLAGLGLMGVVARRRKRKLTA